MSHGSRGFCRAEIGLEGSRETRLEIAGNSGILLEFQAGVPGVGLAGLGRTGGRFWRAQGDGSVPPCSALPWCLHENVLLRDSISFYLSIVQNMFYSRVKYWNIFDCI